LMAGKKPIAVLHKALGKRVAVRLKSNTTYRGRLLHVDAYMNMYLVESEEVGATGPLANLGHVVIRGNNVLYIRVEDQI